MLYGPEGPMSTFEEMPQRIFLDSSVLQALHRYGEFIYDGGALAASDRVLRDSFGLQKLEALSAIMKVGERAPFEFALSQNSFREVGAASDRAYLQWAYAVLDHWRSCLEESGVPADSKAADLSGPRYGYLGAGDRALIRDAVVLGCDTFLTMENRLPRNAPHLQRTLGIRVVSPLGMWELVEPWAGLFT